VSGKYPEALFLARVVVRFFFFQAEDGIRDPLVTGVQTCALPIFYETQEKKDFLYVLALALERRRILKRIGKGEEILELELVKEKRTFQIPMLKLGEEVISSLTEQVGRLLDGSLVESTEGGG